MAGSRRFALGAQPDVKQILLEAQHRWLHPREICELLRNYHQIHICPQPPNLPPSGSVILFDRKVVRNFRNDGHKWRKKKNGKALKECHEKLKVGNVNELQCYYAHGEDNENFQRRSYWILQEEFSNIVLVHYRDVKPQKVPNFQPQEYIVEKCDLDVGSLPSHPSFSSTQTETIGNIPEQGHGISEQLVAKSFGESEEFGSHLQFLGDWQTFENDSASKCFTYSDLDQGLTSKFCEQDSDCVDLLDSLVPSCAHLHNQNDVQRQLPNAEHAHILQSDSERISTVEGKSIYSDAIKQYLLDCSLTGEGLRKIEGSYGLMSEELAGADVQFSSEAYQETVDTENRTDGSSIPTRPRLDTSMPNSSLSEDQLCDIIDFTTNRACVGSKTEGNRTNYNRIKATEETTPYSQEIKKTIPSSEIEGSMSSSFHPNNYHLPSQTTETTSLTSAQASEYGNAESDDYQGKFSDVPGTDFSSLSQADKSKDSSDAGLTCDLWKNLELQSWEDVLENCASDVGSLPFHTSFSSMQPDTMGNIPKQEHELLGQLFTKNWSFGERHEFGSHLPARDWQTSQNGSSLLSEWPMDQKLASDSAHNITSRFHKQGNENDRQIELSNTDRGHHLQLDQESNLAIQGKSLFSSSLKQHLFDGSLNDEGLKKTDSFNRWMSKELGDVKELHMLSSSGAYWDTIANENGIEDSNIPPQVRLDTYILGPSVSQDQLYSIIDFSPNWVYVGSEIKVLITGRFLMSQQEAENNNWSCMFGEVEVPAEILIGGVFRCHTPVQKAGRVPFYVTCSNRLACSELREFEYRDRNVQDVDLADSSGNITIESLRMRLGKLLCLSSISTPNYDPSKLNELSELSSKISSLLKEDNDDWDEMLKLTSEEKFSLEKAKEKLLQRSLKEKLHVWLLQKVAEGGKGPSVLTQDGQGVLHFAAALGYDWALEPTVFAGVNINFRDVNGWTALHWAAYCGRERTVASLISLGAAAGALSDPNPKYPSGQTPADLAFAGGHKGIAGYLAESDLSDLSSRLSSITIEQKGGKASEFSGANAVPTVSHRSPAPMTDEDLRYGLSMKDSLAAVCKATQAAAHIHQVFRVQSFQKKQLKYGEDAFGISDERALLLVAVKSHKAGHHDEPVHAAAVRIQNKFRSWKGRKDFLTIRRQIVKIQAHIRGHQVRKKSIIWSVGILEKSILRWRRKGSGLRGFKSEALTESSSMIDTSTKEDDYDFLKEGRKQKEERLQQALARVKSMVQYPEARDQYSRLLNVVNEIQETKATALNNSEVSVDFDSLLDVDTFVFGDGNNAGYCFENSEVSADFYNNLMDIEALLDDDTFMPTA
ncbi:LOW QUALITY PROTEIN: calmodulin-binding transcription activator 3-like [Pistacia vera]|uniref:LOW QUALITY PROTEIN: calmodulin-binding transcription activator 3-like n=1 Tax=Pistacia vera TaxID=55513 RepID=UPI0012630363|nr:LOW QUALITY PROTEIN: calmodulin-binding transcription activator 3-like [Pistacia vera]